MSLSATLKIGDNAIGNYDREYNVVGCQYKFSCGYNYRLPDTDAKNNSIVITLVSPGKEDLTIYDWYIKRMLLSGQIEFEFPTQTQSQEMKKIVTFENASCFSMSESYDINGKSLRLIKLELVAEKTIVDTIEFQNYSL
ncbi:MAG: type VI secretion system tube protein TssD [Paludibacteraceae bacterium]|jgi:hypothetical protein|nr:type VI secretion system tube protein TssD [Paludibacteraceae bacterium]